MVILEKSQQERDKMKVKCNICAELNGSTQTRPDGRMEELVHITQMNRNSDQDVVIEFEWDFPILDIAGRWHPACRFDRSLRADWSYGEVSANAISAPVISFFNEVGRNRGTFAVSETIKRVRMALGVHEEDGTMKCRIQIELGKYDRNEYTFKLLRDERDVSYEQALREVSIWWEKDCNLPSARVPDSARDPMYSFWYSYHQEFTDHEIEDECRRAKEMGFSTVIVDDGWQTDDTNRGYGYCGDWKPAQKKIKNMRKHVDAVHRLGMKYLIWFSVPYVGIHSEMWQLFHNKLIAINHEQKTGILDIRYPDVRAYLKNIYVNAVKEWDLDGLKLDFIDEFYERPDTPKANPNMDYTCLQEALDQLLSETTAELKNLKPDILIEFRQRYIGPNIRKYGNILRVGDCPESGLSNRVAILDLRLLSGKTAVHSDMLMWHLEEAPEIAALQMIDCLFGTLQFSVRLDRIKDGQKKMVRNYMAFMQEHKTLLQESPIEAKKPQNLYPEARVKDDQTEIIGLYVGNRVLDIDSDKARTIVVNGTQTKSIYVKPNRNRNVKIQIIDCYGEIVNEFDQLLTAIQEVECTVGGRIEITNPRL